MARDSTITKTIERDPEGRPISLTVTVAGHPPIVCKREHVRADLALEAFYHGMSQKLGDAGAISRTIVAGVEVGATPEAKAAAIREVWERVTDEADPQWNARGEGSASAGQLVRAVAEATGLELDAARAAVKAMDAATQKALRNDPTVSPILDRIAREDAARKPGADEAAKRAATVLAELMAKKAA
jgi:hypothetical protein